MHLQCWTTRLSHREGVIVAQQLICAGTIGRDNYVLQCSLRIRYLGCGVPRHIVVVRRGPWEFCLGPKLHFPARAARRGGAFEDTLWHEMVSLCNFLCRGHPDCSYISLLVQ